MIYFRQRTGQLRRFDGATIPADPANRDYREFLAAVADDPSCVADEPAPPLTAEQINADRDAALASLVVEVDGVPFDADPTSRANLSGILTATAAGVPLPWPIPWRGADNVTRPLTQAQAVAAAGAMLAAVQAIYDTSWSRKAALTNSPSA